MTAKLDLGVILASLNSLYFVKKEKKNRFEKTFFSTRSLKML